MTNYQQILEIFCGTDSNREWMLAPNKLGDNIFATDALSMVIVPSKYDPTRPESFEVGIKSLLRFLDYDSSMSCMITFSQIEGALSQCPKELIPATISCAACKGNGLVDFEFTFKKAGDSTTYIKKDDCPVCEGHGELNNPEGKATLEYREDHHLVINASYFRAAVVDKLAFVMKKVNADVCYLVNQSGPEQHSIFTIGDIIVYLMPIKVASSQKNRIKIY